MRTRKWAPLGLASVLAFMSVAAVSAQEQEQEKQEDYSQKDITIRLEAVEGSGASGTATVRFAGDPAAAETGEKVEVAYDLTGLEPATSYSVVIHDGACATGTTRIADLGSVDSDENGQLRTTAEVESQEAVAILTGRDRPMEAEEEEQQEEERQQMARAGVRHLQLQLNGQAVACGNFEPGA